MKQPTTKGLRMPAPITPLFADRVRYPKPAMFTRREKAKPFQTHNKSSFAPTAEAKRKVTLKTFYGLADAIGKFD